MTDVIRKAHCGDLGALALLIHDAIHTGAAGAYDEAQRQAWSPAPRSGSEMAARLAGQTVLVAEDDEGLAGVFTLTGDGLLDLAFVRPDRKGDGLAGRLHDALIEAASAAGLKTLTVEASHLMRRFLDKRGWSFVETQTVHPDGVAMENHRMVLHLA
ncbi:MAG: GNAT family N-acetyltransferase [Alphaproteobacteria bacterium]|nr:GNAT family N-acetyltransferase [Alphaproteobacteria bacterium]